MLMRRLLRSQMAGSQTRMAASRFGAPKGHEDASYSDESRHEDEPAPTEDDMIKIHYLKHHPLYEFKNHEEFHVDNYRHWLHSRIDYYNTETYPEKVNPWSLGNPWGHAFFLVMPFLAFGWIGN